MQVDGASDEPHDGDHGYCLDPAWLEYLDMQMQVDGPFDPEGEGETTEQPAGEQPQAEGVDAQPEQPAEGLPLEEALNQDAAPAQLDADALSAEALAAEALAAGTLQEAGQQLESAAVANLEAAPSVLEPAAGTPLEAAPNAQLEATPGAQLEQLAAAEAALAAENSSEGIDGMPDIKTPVATLTQAAVTALAAPITEDAPIKQESEPTAGKL